MLTIVTHGKPGTAMTSWKTQLNEAEIAAVVDYIRETFMQVALDARLQRGRSLYAQNCMVCHGDRGQGASGQAGLNPPRDFTTPQARAELTRERMLASVTHGTGQHGHGGVCRPAARRRQSRRWWITFVPA